MTELTELYQALGYHFKDKRLLLTALSHRSTGMNNNERLEFLGDSILGFIIAAELYQRHPKAREGELSRMRASLVNGAVLATLARELNIGDYIRLGVGERKAGGSQRDSILADALEAIIGAMYIDGGAEVCRERVLSWYGAGVDDLSTLTPEKDAKSCLQEWLQARKYPLPQYALEISGEAHAQQFHVTCRVVGLDYVATGESTSRRKAEQIAAQKFLKLIDEVE